MDINILNSNFDVIDILEHVESFIWNQRYNEISEMELELLYTEDNIAKCSLGNYIWTTETGNTLMLIEEIELNNSDVDYTTIIVKGRSLEAILSYRMMMVTKNVVGNVQNIIKSLIEENFTEPTNEARTISNFIFVESEDPDIIAKEITETQLKMGDDLLTTISKICQQVGIGYIITFSDAGGIFFQLYNGINRSYDQSILPWVTLSPEYDNIEDTSFFISSKDYKNYTFIAGETKNDVTKYQEAYNGDSEPTGMYRREIYTNASKVKQTVDDVTVSDAEYLEMLKVEGLKKLYDTKVKELFDGSLIGEGEFEYGKDFYLGDIIQAVTAFGNAYKVRVKEVIYAIDGQGYKKYPGLEKIEEEITYGN